MEDNMNCFVAIRSLYPSMHRVEKEIAKFILDKPHTAVNMTIGQLANEVNVAESSIVRFCQRLGFEGFARLKINMATNNSEPKEFIYKDINPNDTSFEVASKVFASSMKALTETINMLDKGQLADAVEALLRAERIEFYGVGTSANLAADAYYRFMRIGLPAYAATDPHIMRVSAGMTRKGCVVVGISHTGRTKDTLRAVEIARSRGAQIICITSFMGSPITELSDIKLVTSTPETRIMKEAVSSRIAHIALLDSLYCNAALKKYDAALENLANMTEILGETRLK